ncbi:hypothetical protein ASD39_01785 [Sphingomonas sp. Root50]|nr:hypothetical protein ASD17_00590 [Sphingomonas sp. Root1294]KQY69070.1 hypothetical protein ASD39_01785 [Sphingomonas sp. Root50]
MLCALLFTVVAWRRRGARWLRFALASFAFFALITATFWIISPDGTARTVEANAGGTLMLQIVQGRGTIVLPFGLAALAAAWLWADQKFAAMLGPFAYNSLMTIEAIRAQFTSLATPERWTYVILHAFWAVCLGIYCSGLSRRLPRRILVAACVSALPILVGTTLYLAPTLLIGASPIVPSPTLLLHSAHAFGASLIGLGLVSFSYWSGMADRLSQNLCLAAAAFLISIAALDGLWPVTTIALAWGALHLLPRPALRARTPASPQTI